MWDLLLPKTKSYLGISDLEADDLIKDLLQYVEDFIYSTYSIAINERELTEYVNAEFGSNVVYTAKGIIQSITSFDIDGISTDISNDVYLKNNSINFLKTSPIILNNSSTYKLVYKVGYSDEMSIPKGLEGAYFQIVKKLYNDITKNVDSYASLSTGIKEAVKIDDNIPLVALQTLQSYKSYRL